VKLNYLLLLWTTGRVIRGIEFVWDEQIQDLNGIFVAMILVTSMILCELIPFLFTMDWDIVSLLLLADEAPALRLSRADSRGGGGAGTGADYHLIADEKDPEYASDKYHVALGEVKFLTNTEDSKESGKFCVIQTGRYKGHKVMIKTFRFVGLSPQMIQNLSEDLIANSTFDHERLAKFYGVFNLRGCISRITEYTEAGSLRDILRECNRDLAGAAILRLALGICEGMMFLHSQSPPAIHGYLKTTNVLVTADMGVKITDIGLRRIKACMELTSIQRSHTVFTAPEVLSGGAPTIKADAYSFGWICWEMLSREPPFKDKDMKWVKDAILRKKRMPPIPEHDDLPSGFQGIIRMTWNAEPTERPGFEDMKRRVVIMTRGDTPMDSIDEEKQAQPAEQASGVVSLMRSFLF